MADPLGDLNVGQAASDFMGVLSGSVWYIVWSSLIIATILVVLYLASYRHRVRLRMLTSQGTIPFDDTAKEVIEDGVRYWKLRKRKDMIPVPPRDCLTTLGKDWTGKLKFYAEIYWSEEYGYIPVLDEVNKENIRNKIVVFSDRNGESFLTKDTFKPFTPQQRALLVTQLRKAQERKKSSFLDKLTQLAVPIMFTMLIICILLFWEDIAKPAQEMGVASTNMMKENEKLLAQNAEISAQNARITQALTGTQIPTTQTIGGG